LVISVVKCVLCGHILSRYHIKHGLPHASLAFVCWVSATDFKIKCLWSLTKCQDNSTNIKVVYKQLQ